MDEPDKFIEDIRPSIGRQGGVVDASQEIEMAAVKHGIFAVSGVARFREQLDASKISR